MITDYIAYFPLTERSGNVTDVVGGITGTNNGTTTTDGIGGAARNFDGTDNIDLGTPSALQFASGSFTFSAWIYPAVNNTMFIFSAGDSAWGIYVNIGPYLEFARTTVANSGQSAATTPLVVGKWNHIVIVNNIGTDLKFYINGILKSNPSFTRTYSYSQNIAIGRTNTEGFPFNGNICQIKIFNRAVTDAEANQLYTTMYRLNNGGVRPAIFKPGIAR